jgi:hypothetical protein
VAFYFSWTNPFQEYAVINAATDMEAAGYIQAYAPWELFGVNFSEVHAKALFSLYGSAGPVAVTAHASADLGVISTTVVQRAEPSGGVVFGD